MRSPGNVAERLRRVPPIALDLSWTDLLTALLHCATRHAPPQWDEEALCCLSVRSAFDLLLRALALPAGSEVLVTAITHPDMIRILRHHGLVPVPVDIAADTLEPQPELLARALTQRTRALLVVHLFGGRVRMDGLAAFCRTHDLLLIEDCAQGFRHKDDRGDSRASITMFSFDPLKTATALGGSLVWVRDAALLSRMRKLHRNDPMQTNRSYAMRVLKCALLLAGLQPWIYSLSAALIETMGTPYIDINRRWMHSFPGGFDVRSLRMRPCPALQAMLEWRWERYDAAHVMRRQRTGDEIARCMHGVEIPGRSARDQSWWIFPVLVKDRWDALELLRRHGFEAVGGLSNLIALQPPSDRPHLDPREARRIVEHAILIPVRVGISAQDAARLVGVVSSLALQGELAPLCT